jgi:hypothetical protein
MENRFHGIVSLALIAGAILLGFLIVLKSNIFAGLLYGALVLIGSILIVYAFCTKCPIRTSECRHVFPGQLTVWLPARPQTAYTPIDYLTVGLVLAVLIVYPHPWLLEHIGSLLVFWFFLAAGLAEIILFVCKGCGNLGCLVCRLRNK